MSCKRCKITESKLRLILKDMGEAEAVASSKAEQHWLNHWGWVINDSLQRILKTPCESDEPPWEQAMGHLCAVENLADATIDDKPMLSQAANDMVHRGLNLVGDYFQAARLAQGYTKADAEADAADAAYSSMEVPHSLKW